MLSTCNSSSTSEKQLRPQGIFANSTGAIDVLKVIKMLYLADRRALVEWHRPITGDQFWSLANGPVVSRTYDLIRGQSWRSRDGRLAGGLQPAKRGLSFTKEQAKHKTPFLEGKRRPFKMRTNKSNPLTTGQVIDLVHKLPEWKDPGKSSLPIDPETIFYHENFGESAVKEIEKELKAFQSAKVALQAS